MFGRAGAEEPGGRTSLGRVMNHQLSATVLLLPCEERDVLICDTSPPPFCENIRWSVSWEKIPKYYHAQEYDCWFAIPIY